MSTENTFNILNEEDYRDVYVTLLDNGGNDLPRMGVGKDSKGVFLVDLEASESPDRVKTYVKRGLDVLDVVRLGIRAEVFQEWASDDIRFRVDEDLQGEWDEFCNSVFQEDELD